MRPSAQYPQWPQGAPIAMMTRSPRFRSDHPRPDRLDHPGTLMAEHHRQDIAEIGHAVRQMHIRPADARGGDADHDLALAGFLDGDLLELERDVVLVQDGGAHGRSLSLGDYRMGAGAQAGAAALPRSITSSSFDGVSGSSRQFAERRQRVGDGVDQRRRADDRAAFADAAEAAVGSSTA